jgi:hypothetical protein
MENKQTAVQWLTYKIEEQRENGNVDLRTTLFYCEQAKEMEKEKMIEFGELVWKNLLRSDKIMKPRDVYNETYGGNK